jgi:pimeloyl-ACP methyl ester carboxylesterase
LFSAFDNHKQENSFMAEEYLPLYFDEEGYPVDARYGRAILEALVNSPKPVSDLWIFSHGWNNDLQGDDKTYHDWLETFRPVIQQEIGDDQNFNPRFVGIHWPSKAWVGDIAKMIPKKEPVAPSPTTGGGEGEFEIGSIPEPAAPSPISSAERRARAKFIAEYRPVIDPNHLYGRSFSHDFGRLYDLMYQSQSPSPAEIAEFVKILKKYTTRDPHSDPSEKSNVVSAPTDLLVARLADQIAEQAVHPEQYEGFFKIDVLLEFFRTFTFWTMKARAAIVGETGVYPFLAAVRQAIVQHNLLTRVHLMGHSFGAKLVTASVYPAAGASNLPLPLVNTLILLQGAFSQFSFSGQIPVENGAAGRYAAVVERGLVANPVVVIYSQKDMANTTCYPGGMALAAPFSDKIYELGGSPDEADDTRELYQVSTNRFGSIGANGAQGLSEKHYRAFDMLPTGQSYPWGDLTGVYCVNVDGAAYIKQGGPPAGAHGDILHPEIYHLALAMSRR